MPPPPLWESPSRKRGSNCAPTLTQSIIGIEKLNPDPMTPIIRGYVRPHVQSTKILESLGYLHGLSHLEVVLSLHSC